MLRTRRERTFFVLAAGAVTLLLFAWNGHSGIAAPLDLLDPYPPPNSSEGDTRAPLKLGHSVQHGHHPHQPVPTPSPAATAPVEPLIANYDGDATPPDVPMPDQHLSSDDFTAPIHPPAASMVPPEPAGSAPPSIAVPTVYVPPRLTLIVLWSPQMREHNYLPNFFASVGANPSIDVLLIKFDKYRLGGDECTKPRAGAAPNVREVCVDMDEYWDLHLEYLCGHWGCNAEQRTRAREVIVKRTGADRVNSFYRPFRAEVFKKYMLPDVKLWAWADLDVVLGNFERIFPWDVASQFDVLIAGWPTNWEHILLYMPGHMTVFRNDPDVAAAFLHLHFLETLDAFVGDDFLSEACEEGEYSHELFMRSGLTFLRFDAMVDAQHHISTLDGVFAIEGDGLSESTILSSAPQISAALREHSANASPRSTFTSEGREELVNVVNDGSRAPFLWFGPQYAVMYESVLTRELGGAGARAMRRYTIRRERGGPVSERAEPEEGSVVMAGAEGNVDNRLWLREALYNHLQAEKYKSWWALPERPVGDGEVLYIDKEHGAHLWNADGNVLWESARAEEHI